MSRFGRGSLWRVGAAAVAAVVVAEAGVWLLRPREPELEPATVREEDYFTEAQLERAREYQGGQRALLVATIAIQGGVLLVLALGRPRFVHRRLEALAGRPLLGAAAAGTGLALALTVVSLPFGAAAHERSVDVGLSTQSFGAWLGDFGKQAAIGAAFAAAGAALLIALLRRFGRLWWIPATGAVIAIEVVFVWLAPVVLAPLFNRFDALPQGRARSDVLELGRRAGVEIGEVYRVDASRRSTSLNAYVDGLGPTKRVVLYDNLLRDVERPALRSVVAHELAHVEHRDILRGMAWVALAAPLALLFVGELGSRLARRGGAEPDAPAALPAFALALALAATVLGVIGNQLSREVEESADRFALQLTDDPGALIDLQRRLAIANVSDPDPPGVVRALLRTHPTTTERIGAAAAWRERERSR
jgi:STE24 endopeptidase